MDILLKAFKKTKDFVVKYWKILIAFCLVLLGYLIAKRSDNTKILKSDLDVKEKALKKQIHDIEKLHKDHDEKNDELIKKI